MHRAAPPSASHAFSEARFLPVSSKHVHERHNVVEKMQFVTLVYMFSVRDDAALASAGSPSAGSGRCRFGSGSVRTNAGSDQCRLRAASVRPVLAQGNAGFGRPNILPGPAHSPWFLRGMRAPCVSSVRQRDRVKQSEYVHRGRFWGAAGAARRELPPVKREPHGIRLKTPFNRLR